MTEHHSKLFSYNTELTAKVYDEKSSHYFVNDEIKNRCLNLIIDSMERNRMNIGIDFTKPSEDFHLNEDFYEIEYLFVGELTNSQPCYIIEDILAIHIFPESRFGESEFNSKQLLNLTLIINKT